MRMPRPKRTTVDPPSTAATAYLAIPSATGSLGSRESVAAHYRCATFSTPRTRIARACHPELSQQATAYRGSVPAATTPCFSLRGAMLLSRQRVLMQHVKLLNPLLTLTASQSANSAHGGSDRSHHPSQCKIYPCCAHKRVNADVPAHGASIIMGGADAHQLRQ